MNHIIAKEFNTAGPCNSNDHYMLPALSRLPTVINLVNSKKYFVLHAPRQSGKTTSIKALTDELNNGEHFYALYCSLETLRGKSDPDKAMTALVAKLKKALSRSPVTRFRSVKVNMEGEDPSLYASTALNQISMSLDKPLVVFFDEVDTLSGEVAISFLSQLRDGFVDRSDSFRFPNSIALIGMRNIRDYIIQVRPEEKSLGSGSPFNVAAPLILANFTKDEVRILYKQHTETTTQVIEDSAIERAWYWSEGQPWLVNALAKEAVEEILANAYAIPITDKHIDQAAETLILRRDTHIDSLLARLSEPRIRRIVQPIILGSAFFEEGFYR
jgi:type II secretory pathway predicted ATPase ExeA